MAQRIEAGRRAMRGLAALMLALTIAGCAGPTPYQPLGDGYGFADQALENDRYRVSFFGNSLTPRATVENYLLYHAAEVTLARGADYFVMAGQQTEATTSYQTLSTGPMMYGGWGYGGYPGIVYPAFPAISTSTPIKQYEAYADIVLHRGDKPSGDFRAFNAREVIAKLGPIIVRPGPG